MRKRLSEKASPRTSALFAWFDDNPGAKEFVELWLDMALKGETDWSLARVARELVDVYGYPFGAHTGTIGRRLRERYGERYDVAVERAEMTRKNKRG